MHMTFIGDSAENHGDTAWLLEVLAEAIQVFGTIVLDGEVLMVHAAEECNNPDCNQEDYNAHMFSLIFQDRHGDHHSVMFEEEMAVGIALGIMREMPAQVVSDFYMASVTAMATDDPAIVTAAVQRLAPQAFVHRPQQVPPSEEGRRFMERGGRDGAMPDAVADLPDLSNEIKPDGDGEGRS